MSAPKSKGMHFRTGVAPSSLVPPSTAPCLPTGPARWQSRQASEEEGICCVAFTSGNGRRHCLLYPGPEPRWSKLKYKIARVWEENTRRFVEYCKRCIRMSYIFFLFRRWMWSLITSQYDYSCYFLQLPSVAAIVSLHFFILSFRQSSYLSYCRPCILQPPYFEYRNSDLVRSYGWWNAMLSPKCFFSRSLSLLVV